MVSASAQSLKQFEQFKRSEPFPVQGVLAPWLVQNEIYAISHKI